MKLHEIINPQHYEIKQWLDKMGIKNYTIRPDGVVRSATNPEGLVVDVNGSVDLFRKPISSIPVQFGKVTGWFICSDTNISSLDGFPSGVGGGFNCSFTKIKSLQGIHKIIKQLGGWFFCNPTSTHILGLLLIPGLKGTRIDDGPIDKIMNAHLADQDIVAAQDELIDAGFIEQAKL